MKINFCTLLDKEYISRFVVLKQSLENFKLDYRFYVLCLDNFTVNFFQKNNFKNLEIVTFEEIEKNIQKLI